MAETIAIRRRSIPAWAGETPSANHCSRSALVYPRVGGGNVNQRPPSRPVGGLSPRGRGKPFDAGGRVDCGGSIPAWAGETSKKTTASMLSRVYPRVGGGNDKSCGSGWQGSGLSPRGRGKRPRARPSGRRRRSIPAWAGETQQTGPDRCRDRVYPRGGRGKRGSGARKTDSKRSIPAWAGETHWLTQKEAAGMVYPRVGGGNPGGRLGPGPVNGLSPRGRGKPAFLHARRLRRRSIPAWAGETATATARPLAMEVYPRVGGGNNVSALFGYRLDGLSPRGRGKLRGPSAGTATVTVYPRVGGGNQGFQRLRGR